MAEIRDGLKYSDRHFWIEVEDDSTVRVGLTDYGQAQLGEVVGATLPSEGDAIEADTAAGEVEAEESSTEIISPVSGTILEVNGDLEESPTLVNEDPYGDGWLFLLQLSDPEELEDLLSAAEYEEFLQSEEEEEEEDEE